MLRRLAPADAPAYRALMLEAYARHPDAFTSSVAEREAKPIAFWESRLDPAPEAQEIVFGAFTEGRLTAVAGITFEAREKARHKATLFGMYVAAACRRSGVGRRLVDAVLDCARARRGVFVVQLTVTDGNAEARGLYERCGFVAFGVEPYAVAVDGAHVAKVHMWCDLRAAAARAASLPTSGVRIRAAVPPDAPRCAALATQVWLDTYARDGIREALADYVLRELTVERMQALLGDPHTRILVAERDAHLVGLAVLMTKRAPPGRDDANAAEIDRLYVQEAWCGRGVGTQLLGAIERLATGERIGELWLSAWAHNTRALRFYARRGYADIGATHFALDGERHENRVLAKAVAAA
jgi:ribosomal protein S18 acetylase RimI-like enzyme